MYLTDPRVSPTWWRSRTAASRSRFRRGSSRPSTMRTGSRPSSAPDSPSTDERPVSARIEPRRYRRPTPNTACDCFAATRSTPGIPSTTERCGRCSRCGSSSCACPAPDSTPQILSGLETMLNDDALPELRQYASIGTGDLAPLAGTALTLIGERPASKPLTPMAAVGRRQRAAVHEQQRADRRARLPCAGRAFAPRKGVECDLHAEFPRARRQSRSAVIGGGAGVGGPLRRHRRGSPALAAGDEGPAGPPARPHPGSLRAAGVPGSAGKRAWRRCIRSRNNSSGHSTPRRRIPSSTSKTTPSSITAPSTRHRCHSNWTAPPWRSR